MHAPLARRAAPTANTLKDDYASVRARTLALAAPLSEEDQALQSMPDASPVKWHLAHTTWFFETFVLARHATGWSADPVWRRLFNSYYDGVGPAHERARRGALSRPGLAEVRDWRARVDAAVIDLLSGDADRDAPVAATVELGLHHEQQHQELILSDVKHLFSLNPLLPAYAGAPQAADALSAPAFRFVDVAGGLFAIGADDDGFSFDNERPRGPRYLRDFRIANRAATNAEFLAFIEDGGYRRSEFWLADGWGCAKAEGWTAPLYWRREDGFWTRFSLHGALPLDPAAPAMHLSYYEADAFARWSGARLPTEEEWEVAARLESAPGDLAEDGRLDPAPAAHANLAQMTGDVWEWTSSAYGPYPGFRPLAGALGEYNGKFMSGRQVLRGGAFATPARHYRPSYRNYYPPSARWAFSGVRLAADA